VHQNLISTRHECLIISQAATQQIEAAKSVIRATVTCSGKRKLHSQKVTFSDKYTG